MPFVDRTDAGRRLAGALPAIDEEVAVTAGAVRRGGHLTVPDGAAEVVVFAHGSGSSRHSPRNRFVARVLNDAGLGTLLFDLLTGTEELDRANVFDIELLGRREDRFRRWEHRTGHIVVGVDESDSSRAALAWAAAEARDRDEPLDVLYAWAGIGIKVARESGWVKAVTGDMERAAADQVIERAVTDVLGEHPDVKVLPHPVPGEAAEALIEASKDAALLVVGSRGVGGFDGLHLGSVSEKCVHHAHCPVVVVRDADS